jgi:heme-degrading monooxygenase HmoA
MVTRIVKMSFNKIDAEVFLEIFNEHRNQIRAADGCTYLELWQTEEEHSTIFFTHSKWENEDFLNNYRHSDIFKIVWPKTKALFNASPQAWTVNSLVTLP